MKPSELQRLDHIIEATDRILRFTYDMGYGQFMKDELVFFATIKNFEIIGEACYKLDRSFRDKYDYIEW